MFHIVWYKRDLRIFDHEPMAIAAASGDVLPIYVFEPSVWQFGDLSIRHEQFVRESLLELQQNLVRRGGNLIIATGEMIEVLTHLHEQYGGFTLHSHMEHGISHTYERDRLVKKFMKKNKLVWREYAPTGVQRANRPYNQNQFIQAWENHMNVKPFETPRRIESPLWLNDLRDLRVDPLNLRLTDQINHIPTQAIHGEAITNGQHGGETFAHDLLRSFLTKRSRSYNMHISKPTESQNSCSRLSPYLSWGCISMRFVLQSAQEAYEQADSWHRKHIASYGDRLRWHDHFTQNLEYNPNLNEKAIQSKFDRTKKFDEDLYEAWLQGQTGYPFIDACMRQLHATGYLHFRGRAAIVSFLTLTMWQDWRDAGMDLANLFLDYDPGIHWNQMQLQAATTNSTEYRIYDPIKQSLDHDNMGVFIKQWIPELRHLDAKTIHEPWKSANGYDHGYARRVVDHTAGNEQAKKRLYGK